MIGISQIGTYIPPGRISNYERMDRYGVDEYFIENRSGITNLAKKNKTEETSDMASKAVKKLFSKIDLSYDQIDCVFLITQNPDRNIPHTSAKVHGELGLSNHCACCDISLGCSGFVHGLSIIKGFMENNNMQNGLLITADPYSKIISSQDKSTSLLFGDAAAATLISTNPNYLIGKFSFGTIGKESEHLSCINNTLHMNGRAIFNFAAKNIPKDVEIVSKLNRIGVDQIDRFIFHQGSKYIIDTLTKRLRLNPAKVPFSAHNYGNLVSSSIPVILEEYISDYKVDNILLSGFGVGLSWASTIVRKNNYDRIK